MVSIPGTYIVPSHIHLRQAVEVLAVWHCLHDLLEGEVHPCVAIDKVAVQCLPIFEFDQHGMANGSSEEA